MRVNDDIVDQLGRNPVFGTLSDEARHRLAAAATPVHLAHGIRLFAAGDPGDAAYLLISGELEVSLSRADGSETPVLFLTAKDALDDRIAGLTAGGDDYVTKPFSLEELVARMRGLIRRSTLLANDADDPEVVVGDLVLNEDSHEVRRAGTDIELTATEFELLRFLMRNPRRVLSKAQILDRVWQYDFGGQANVVELYISYLRKKIDAGRAPMIHTMRGVGYVLKPAQ